MTAVSGVCAPTNPHAYGGIELVRTWTNDDLDRLSKVPGLISIVGPEMSGNDAVQDLGAPAPQSATQAVQLKARLQTEEADLRNFIHALHDARELNTTTGGINPFAEAIGITPNRTIDILQNGVRETQSELDAPEDLGGAQR